MESGAAHKETIIDEELDQELALDRMRQEGIEAFYGGNLETAEALFSQGLQEAKALEQDYWIARFHNDLGNLRDRLGHYDRALAHHSEALEIQERLNIPGAAAISLNNLGTVYDSLGLFEMARAYYARSLEIREQFGEPAEVATSLNNLGVAYGNLGEYNRAIDCHLASLAIREECDNPRKVAQSYYNLAAIYSNLGQADKAMDYASRSLIISQEIDDPDGVAAAFNLLGTCYVLLGQFEAALDHHARSWAIYEKLGYPRDTSQSLNNLGEVSGLLDRHDAAVDYLTRALVIRERLGNPQYIATTLDQMGGLCDRLNREEEAEKCLARAFALRQGIGQAFDIAETSFKLGRLHQKRERLDEAEQKYSHALSALESVGEQIADPGQLGAIQQRLPHFYASYASLLVRRDRPGDAVAMLDRGRAQGLARQAAVNGVDFTTYLTADEARDLTQARSDYSAANRTRLAVQSRPDPEDPDELQTHRQRIQEANDRLEEAERKLTLLYDGLLARYPAYRQVLGQQPLTPDQLRQLARDHPDTLYLQYAVVDNDTTLLFALSAYDGLQTFTLPIGDKTLPIQTQQWRDSLLAPQYLNNPRVPLKEKASWKQRADAEPHEAAALYRLLLGPLEDAGLLEPERYARLVIVADGPLLDIPFAALIDNTGQRLIDRYSLSTAFSFSVLTWSASPSLSEERAVMDEDRVPQVRAGRGRGVRYTLLCLADPNGSYVEQFATRRGWHGLPHAQSEAQQVAALFPGAQALVGADVREKTVKRAMPCHALLHFATHGDLNERDGLRSGLVLADNLLEAREIAGLRLSAKLAVLSACDSGRGQQRGGDGLVGLAWAFRAAGCPSVVASSWPVDDAATAHLMVAFYQGLKTGLPKDEALQAAMLQVRQEPDHAAPYYWAGFQVFGDTSPLPSSLR